MKDLNTSISISTFQIVLDNINCDIVTKPFEDIQGLEMLVSDLIDDCKMMLEDFGKEDLNVKKYIRAINEINKRIVDLK